MKIRVIDGRCCGHARCAEVAPDVYSLDDVGYLTKAPEQVAPDQFEAARRGASACPERAIEIVED